MEGRLERIAITYWAHQDSNLEARDYEFDLTTSADYHTL